MATETHQAMTAEATFAAWLDRLTTALAAADVAGTTALLAVDCWWRDLLALTWDLGVYHGRDKVAAITSSVATGSANRFSTI